VLCRRTPCVLHLLLGRHDLAFVSDDGATGFVGRVFAQPLPTVALQQDSRGSRPGLVLVGVPLALAGSAFAAFGATVTFDESRGPVEGVGMFLLGSSVAFLGSLLAGLGASTQPPGVAQWTAH
jgi:hypothetical protein